MKVLGYSLTFKVGYKLESRSHRLCTSLNGQLYNYIIFTCLNNKNIH